MHYKDGTHLFQLLNNNELIALEEERHSLRKDRSRRTDLLYLFHCLPGQEPCGSSAYKRKRCAVTPLNNGKSKPRIIIFINLLQAPRIPTSAVIGNAVHQHVRNIKNKKEIAIAFQKV